MLKKIRHIPAIFLVAFIAVGLWALVTFDYLMDVSVRTSTTTQVSEPPLLPEETPLASSAAPEALSEPVADEPSTQVVAPPPSERVPGSQLSEQALNDLGLEQPIEEEQVFYATATTPNDTIYPQWYTTIIEAPDAWDRTTGSTSTTVAVIDTGYALDHEDLNAAWFINTGEQGMTQSGDTCWTGTAEDKQTNSCDDDDNGYIDDWRGWDFAGDDNNVQTATNSAVGSSHGTKSAGLVGGRSNNSTGTASVNWETKILPLQALYDEGYGYSTDITAAIYYAVLMDVDVINMSLGGPSPDSYTRAAVQYALQNDVIVVTSSGNCGDQQTSPSCSGHPSPGGMGYPARYPETIAVGATTASDNQASFSSWGDELTIVAPGSGSIQTPTWTSSNATTAYATSSYGTSFSSPIVAGSLAIIKAEFPELTTDEAIALIANSSDKVAGMGTEDWTQRYGWGRLNLNNLLAELDEYERQLQKGAGQTAQYTTTTVPQVASNTGHSASNPIVAGDVVTSYCLASPGALCTLTAVRVGGGNYTLGTLPTNSQGIAVFKWSKEFRPAGTYDLSTEANSLNSTNERLYLN